MFLALCNVLSRQLPEVTEKKITEILTHDTRSRSHNSSLAPTARATVIRIQNLLHTRTLTFVPDNIKIS
jgi:hypothetical protein